MVASTTIINPTFDNSRFSECMCSVLSAKSGLSQVERLTTEARLLKLNAQKTFRNPVATVRASGHKDARPFPLALSLRTHLWYEPGRRLLVHRRRLSFPFSQACFRQCSSAHRAANGAHQAPAPGPSQAIRPDVHR